MKQKTTLMIIFSIFAYLLLSSFAYAVSLGDIPPTQKLVQLKPGESIKLKMGFFTMDDNDIVVQLSQLTPIESSSTGKDLEFYFLDENNNRIGSVVVKGNSMTQNPDSNSEWFVLSDGKTYVRVTPVYLFIRVPNKPTFYKNRYNLVISAKTIPESTAGGTITQKLAQERLYNIEVIISGVVATPSVSGSSGGGEGGASTTAGVIWIEPIEEYESSTTSASTQNNLQTEGNKNKGKIPLELSDKDKFINENYLPKNETLSKGTESSQANKITGKLSARMSSAVANVNTTTALILIFGTLGLLYLWKKL